MANPIVEALRAAIDAVNIATEQVKKVTKPLNQLRKAVGNQALAAAVATTAAMPIAVKVTQEITRLEGERGQAGERGQPGESGTPGSRGRQGRSGEKGDAGVQGERGESGRSGAPGPAGEPGVPGEAGAKGDLGEQGAIGGRGRPGIDGASGQPGPPGPSGAVGAPGAAGAAGPSGSAGAPGIAPAIGDALAGVDLSGLASLSDIVNTVSSLETRVGVIDSFVTDSLLDEITDLRDTVSQCAPIAIRSLPIIIDSPGSYCLDADFTGGRITIDADEVELDLNQHTLTQTEESRIAIEIVENRSDIGIRNGHIVLAERSTLGIFIPGPGRVARVAVENLVFTTELDVDSLGMSVVNVDDLLVRDSFFGTRNGIVLKDSGDVAVRRCRADFFEAIPVSAGGTNSFVFVESGLDQFEMTDCDVRNYRIGLLCGVAPGILVANFALLKNSTFSNCVTGARFYSEIPLAIVEDCRITDSIGAGSKLAFTVSTADEVIIRRCTIERAPIVGSFGFVYTELAGAGSTLTISESEARDVGVGIITLVQGGTLNIENCKTTGCVQAGISVENFGVPFGALRVVGNYSAGNGASPSVAPDSNYFGFPGFSGSTPGAAPYFQVLPAGATFWDNVTAP